MLAPNKYIALLVLPLLLASAYTRDDSERRVEPPFWWSDMPVRQLQILIHEPGVGSLRASVSHPGVRITKQLAVDSINYLFLYLDIDPTTSPGTFAIELTNEREKRTLHYELRARENGAGRNQGFDASDVIYLMMPDRFANGDASNDSIPGMLESADRSDPTKRQGGDIQGILDHLDYISELGMTAIWFTPIFENDMPPDYGAYHGYASTDLYRVDRRFGDNEQYRRLVSAAHEKGLKVIMDMIHNHIGIEHWWMKDQPTADWIHSFNEHGQTNFRGSIPPDPYASKADTNQLVKGWFVPEMPDLDQRNELLSDYLIQNTLWWIEYSGIDGIRMDTYLYPYPDYMARWSEEVLSAYPNFNIIGEAWVETVAHEAFWQYDPPGMHDGYDSNLPSVTDFPLCFALREGLIEDFGRQSGISRLYYTLSQDSLYADASKNIIFLDNHDMPRIYEQVGKDEGLFRIAYTILMTIRGIPQVYYGTELMMGHEHRGGDDEAWRQSMPGGWPNDSRSVFSEKGRLEAEDEAFDFVKKLTHWRKTSAAAQAGRQLHFFPDNNVYVYFRIHDAQSIMVAINMNDSPLQLETKRFAEILQDFSLGKDPIAEQSYELGKSVPLEARSALLLELEN